MIFTFHYGRINTNEQSGISQEKEHFTFHYGRINTASVNGDDAGTFDDNFTFHYGRINTSSGSPIK